MSGIALPSPDAPPSTRSLDRCLVCGGAHLRPLAMRYEYRRAAFPLVECGACRMRFLSVQPVGASLASLYDEPYFQADYRCGRGETSSFDEQAFIAENRGLLHAFEGLRPPGRLLEIGCASGWLLEHARARGWRVWGVEPAAAAAAHARGLGLEVFQGDLLAAGLPAASFDLAYMGDVLEHVPDCRATVAEVERVLAPGGFLYLRGPITTHSLARSLGLALYAWAGRPIVLREPPYHLWEFTPRSLRNLLRLSGLTVISLRQSKIPPGRGHGEKSGPQRAVMAALDAVNLPLTRACNARGDRVVVVARKGPPARHL